MKSIRVIGLTDTERHAFNSVVRLSQGRNPSYTIWQQGDGRPDILCWIVLEHLQRNDNKKGRTAGAGYRKNGY